MTRGKTQWLGGMLNQWIIHVFQAFSELYFLTKIVKIILCIFYYSQI